MNSIWYDDFGFPENVGEMFAMVQQLLTFLGVWNMTVAVIGFMLALSVVVFFVRRLAAG